MSSERITTMLGLGGSAEMASAPPYNSVSARNKMWITYFISLLHHALPHFFNGQTVAQFAIVMPFVPIDLPFEYLGLAFNDIKVLAQAVLRHFFVGITFDCVAA